MRKETVFQLIESGSRQSIFGGYVFAAILMFVAAVMPSQLSAYDRFLPVSTSSSGPS
jgi:hypothetical protein